MTSRPFDRATARAYRLVPPLPAHPGRPRIAILGPLALGELVCAVPTIRAIRAANPDGHLSLIGLARSRPLVRRLGVYLDELLEFPGFPGVPGVELRAETLVDFLGGAISRELELAINLHGDPTRTNAFIGLLGANSTAGLYQPGSWRPDPETFVPVPAHVHEVRRPLAVLRALGIPEAGDALEFPVLERDRAALRAEIGTPALAPNDYVVIHPGAPEANRRWGVDGFTRVADSLGRRGLRVVLSGTNAERTVTSALARATRSPVVDLTGRTPLPVLAALVADARLVLTNDTGISQLAAAVRTPSVVVFLSSDPERWAPLDRDLHLVVGEGVPEGCRPDGLAACDAPTCQARRAWDASGRPLTTVGVAEVLRAVERQLAQGSARVA